jgi:hypothetical protein
MRRDRVGDVCGRKKTRPDRCQQQENCKRYDTLNTAKNATFAAS